MRIPEGGHLVNHTNLFVYLAYSEKNRLPEGGYLVNHRLRFVTYRLLTLGGTGQMNLPKILLE
ncbi:MAG TPA: hypothetical protein PLE33_05590 [Candidatus Cloacimonas sp.]|nr:hypothetical protein [Candidatus Cloacimonas sp.]HPS60717.1 hypothetical protein [Candidatus Cloacimonas sp.]